MVPFPITLITSPEKPDVFYILFIAKEKNIEKKFIENYL